MNEYFKLDYSEKKIKAAMVLKNITAKDIAKECLCSTDIVYRTIRGERQNKYVIRFILENLKETIESLPDEE